MAHKKHRIFKILFKTVVVLISTIVFLLLLITTLLIIPPTGNFITQKVVSKAEKQLQTDIAIGSIRYVPPAQITVNDFYIQGTDKDTLVAGKRLAVSVRLIPLLKSHLVVEHAELEHAYVRLNRNSRDSLFNFSFGHVSESTADTTSSDHLRITVGTVMLDHIRFLMEDAVSKSNIAVNLGQFKLEMNAIDLQKNNYDINNFELSGTSALIETGSVTEVSSVSTEPLNLIVKLKRKGSFKNCSVKYADASGSVIDASHINLVIRDNTFDLEQQSIVLNSLDLNNISLMLKIPASADTSGNSIQTNRQSTFTFPDWQIAADKISLEDNQFILDTDQQRMKEGFDPGHIHISELSGEIDDLELDDKGLNMNLEKFALLSGNQFRIKNFGSGISVNQNELNINSLVLNTSASTYNGSIRLSYNSLVALTEQPQSIDINTFRQDASMNIRDVAYFLPELSDSFPDLVQNGIVLNIRSDISGMIDSLNISQLEFSSDNKVKMAISGKVFNATNIDQLRTDLTIKHFWLNYLQLKPYLTMLDLPEGLVLPDTLSITGYGSGGLYEARTEVQMSSVQGKIVLKGTYRKDTVQQSTSLTAKIGIPEYKLGVLLDNPDTIGALSATANLNAVLVKDKLQKLDGDVKIRSLDYGGYTYKNITANAEQRNDTLYARINSADPNLKLTTDASYYVADSVSVISLALHADYIDLQSLKLRNEDFRMSGMVRADISGSLPNEFNSSLVINKLVINRNNTVYYPDSLFLSAKVGDTSNIKLISPFAHAEYNGTLQPMDLGNWLMNYVPFIKRNGDSPDVERLKSKSFTFKLRLEEDPVYTQLLTPGLKQLNPTTLNASYNENDGLHAELVLPYLEYNSMAVDSLFTELNADQNKFNYRSGFRQVNSGSVTIPATRISGILKDSLLFNTLDLPYDENHSAYFIQARLSKNGNENLQISILPDSLILNRSPWRISKDNAILLKKNRTLFSNFQLSHNSDTLSVVSSRDYSDQDQTEINFSNFNLKTLASLAEYDGKAPSAVINGKAVFGKKDSRSTFTSDLLISDLKLFGNTVFDMLDLKAEQTTADLYDFNIDLQNNGRTSRLQGQYKVGEITTLDMDIVLNRFTLSPFAPLLESQFYALTGELSGQLKLSGSTDKPMLNGQLRFDSLLVNPVLLNSPLTMNDATVEVRNNTLQFNKTTIADKNKHKAVLNGTLAYRPENKTTFNLNFKANDFMFINVDKNELDLYHGTLITDVDASLTGNLNRPVLNMKTTIKEGSDLHFTVPEASSDPGEEQDVAEFINKDTSVVTRISDQSLNYSGSLPDITANISFQDNIPVTIVIDPVTKEQLQVSGKGDLSLRLSGNSEPSLSGRYTINSGKYTLLLYNVFKRTFNIRQGSYLLWTGNVLKPEVDLVASFDVNTSPIGLVANELNAGSQSLSQYRKPLPFSVVMNLKGDLLSPDINFDIETPPGKADALVSEQLNRLNSDESAVNKQVLSLLIFKSFMNQNVGGPDMAYRLNNTARNGLSNILSNSFNQFAQNYIKGINLTLDVESRAGLSNTSSGNTDLVFGASKTLFSDRLTIEVGSSINVENENSRPPGSNTVAGDFKIDYKVSKEGGISVQAFRSSEYEDVLVGDVVKTGIALKLSKAFTHFSELFKRKNKKKTEGENDNTK
ncbi:translocation/assembly module TamB domain-containing protein [Saccharicrinis sp. FJH54]|uniref:translocation/assembly module TamB domain-containing protein n=1 Tax=Saccharicrinis sp. FJH54 TaxID=3344665 RepID=UPI0035D4B1DD